MSLLEQQALWQRLEQQGLVDGEDPPATTTATPWYIRVMQGVAGWIGAAFLLFFVGAELAFVFNSPTTAFFFDVIACTVAKGLLRGKPRNDFATQFGLALSIAGQGLVFSSLSNQLHSTAVFGALCLGLFQSILSVAIPNFVHRVWTSLTGAFFFLYPLLHWHLQAYTPVLLSLACIWVWLNEFNYPRHATMLRAGGYGLTMALVFASATAVSGATNLLLNAFIQSPGSPFLAWIGTGLCGATLFWAVRCLLIREEVSPASMAGIRILAATAILALATLKAPGLAPATLILLLGFSNGNRVLFGFGVISLLCYLSFYYYSLEATLLYKSVLMTATGIALLAARFMFQKGWAAPQQEDVHA